MNAKQRAGYRAQQIKVRCSECGKLLDSLGTFGTIRRPLCWDCYSGEWTPAEDDTRGRPQAERMV